jgi:serine/threonine-protein kinase
MLNPGDSFERYTIEAAIGQGGMGSVYRAYDARLGRRVALKVISEHAAGDKPNARLVREARAAAALDHPNAVSIFDVGEAEGVPYIVMELVPGKTLRGALEGEEVPLSTRIEWLTSVARALAAAHRRGLVHRDIKPENVMVRDDGVVKVLDFGIARRAGGIIDPHAGTQSSAIATLTLEGVRLGTPVYMAPEQIRDQDLDGRVDQFAWGVLAYELLAGRLPWRGTGDALTVVASILTDEADGAALDRASVPRGVRDVVLRALSKRPDDRFATMDDLLRALADASAAEAPGARSLPPERAPADTRIAAAPALKGRGAPAEGASGDVTGAQRYSTQEVRDVLAKAVEQQAARHGDARLGFADLLAIAGEVGVDEESLREASRALRARDERPRDAARDDEESAAWIRGRRRAFFRHLGVWMIVNMGLMLLGLVIPGPPLWPFLMPALAWGVGLGIHGLIALTSSKDEWADQKKQMDYWHDQMRRRHEVAIAKAAGVTAPPRRVDVSGPRVRVDEPAEPERVKARVATDTARELAAEEEAQAAQAAEERKGKRRRR